jgi:hypothetical protein
VSPRERDRLEMEIAKLVDLQEMSLQRGYTASVETYGVSGATFVSTAESRSIGRRCAEIRALLITDAQRRLMAVQR